MITTPQTTLQNVSGLLNEQSTDNSLKRLRLFNISCRFLINAHKWRWSRKKHQLSLTENLQEYNLNDQISDYNDQNGLYSVVLGGVEIDPYTYEIKGTSQLSQAAQSMFTISPDGHTIEFNKTIDGTETIELWYYARHIDVDSEEDTLNIPISESAADALELYLKHLVHNAKRQRNDARNALLEFQEALDDAIYTDSKEKSRRMKKVWGSPLGYAGFRRDYSYTRQ